MKKFGKIVICLIDNKIIGKSNLILNSRILTQPNKNNFFYCYFHYFTYFFFLDLMIARPKSQMII